GLNEKAGVLLAGLRERAAAANVPFTTNQMGGMFGCFFSEEESVTRFEQVTACNIKNFQTFFHGMLDNGVYLAPSAYEAGFISTAHGDAEIQHTLDAAEKAFSLINS
ncbi:MAG TPA: aspartate aminotransferase family protein, partial [Gammaproteobacteria bacterium]|nr:aspartate aminotransferase family protein [Gammaproteobacteria bacterium]